MEHNSSYLKQLRKKLGVRTVLNKKIRNLKGGIVKNIEKFDDLPGEINEIKKTIRRRRQKDREHRENALRVDELKNLKTEIRNTIDPLKQRISHIEGANDQVKHEIEQLKRKIKNLPSQCPFDFTEYFEMQKEENEVDLGLF